MEGCLQGEGVSMVGPHQTLTLGWPEGRKSFGVLIFFGAPKERGALPRGIKTS